jgi:energy-coupling factor transporter ATP-binding protein EcfA2
MQLGDILVARWLATRPEIWAMPIPKEAKTSRSRDKIIAMELLMGEPTEAISGIAPPVPRSLAETGITERNLLYLMLKFMHVEACETIVDLAEHIRLPRRLVQFLIEIAVQQRLIGATGAASDLALSTRYALTEAGRNAARDALDQNHYLGPAPVPLAAYRDQIEKQRITNEMLDEAALRRGFAGLVVPDQMIRRLLPAINAGRSVLLYGPPGNGKTTLSTRIAALFKHPVYIPHAVEAAGQIIKVFDVQIHQPRPPETATSAVLPSGLTWELADQRWVACSRPVVMAGGEMTLDMLDLQWNAEARFYDAPLHVKALNGMMLIDDFGRQKFAPNDLLNRWIVPMENQIDFMKLHTGASFTLPFDVLLMFSTNLNPPDLMDAAFLRRIQYKIKLFAPSRNEYRQIFAAVARSRDLEWSEEVFDYIVSMLTPFGLAYYQPRFICDHVHETCKSFNLPPCVTIELASEALANLYVDIEERRGDEQVAA